MAYGDTKEKQRGIKNEPIIAKEIAKRLKDLGYRDIEIGKSNLNEDCKDHIDRFIKMISPDGRKIEFSFDIKDGFSFTPINNMGERVIDTTKADYLLYRFPKNTIPDEYTKYFFFINFSKFRELYYKYKPRLSDSFKNNSKWFSMSQFIEDHKFEFGKRDIIKIKR